MVKHGSRLWHTHPGVTSGNDLTLGERGADALKHWFGTWTALGFVAAYITFWWYTQHDPGHLNLNLTLSCVAAVQGIVLQIAANRGDRISAEVALHTEGNTTELVALNRQQIEILRRLDGLDGKVADLAGVLQQVMASRAEHDAAVAADAKAARQSAESAFVATQALSAVATASPGLGELAASVAANTEAVRAVHAAVRALPDPVKAVEAAAARASGMGSRIPPKAGGTT